MFVLHVKPNKFNVIKIFDRPYMVSFKVTALFTSIPLNEVIELIITRIYVNNELIVKFPTEDLCKIII